MPQAWSAKDERKYEHIKQSVRSRGQTPATASEIAARTVNKDRAREGRAATASRTSTGDISSSRRGGLRSGTARPKGRTRDQLYAEARRLHVRGRSRMRKAELERAVDAHRR
jgi:hypothetical protein